MSLLKDCKATTAYMLFHLFTPLIVREPVYYSDSPATLQNCRKVSPPGCIVTCYVNREPSRAAADSLAPVPWG